MHAETCLEACEHEFCDWVMRFYAALNKYWSLMIEYFVEVILSDLMYYNYQFWYSEFQPIFKEILQIFRNKSFISR